MSASDAAIGVVLMAYGTPRAPGRDRAVLHRHPPRPPADRRTARRPHPPLRRDRRRCRRSPQRTEAQRGRAAGGARRVAPGAYTVALGLKHADPTIEDGGRRRSADRRATAVVGARARPALLGAVGRPVPRPAAGAAGGEHDVAVHRHRVVGHRAGVRRVPRRRGRARGSPRCRPNTKVVFTAHSLPRRILDGGDRTPTSCAPPPTAVAAAAGLGDVVAWAIAWQSAGRTPEPWIGPTSSR